MSMTRDELLAKLNSVEWNDIEFKAGAWEAPKSAMSTVSAFALFAGREPDGFDDLNAEGLGPASTFEWHDLNDTGILQKYLLRK